MHLRRECDDAHGDEHRERRHARKEGPLRPSALLRQNDTQAQMRQLRSPSPTFCRPKGPPAWPAAARALQLQNRAHRDGRQCRG